MMMMMMMMMMGMMMMMNFKDFAKVDDSVLLWHPICKCSSIMLIFILALFSAGKSKRNFPKKFLKHENQRLYSTSFSTMSICHNHWCYAFQKGQGGTPIILIINE